MQAPQTSTRRQQILDNVLPAVFLTLYAIVLSVPGALLGALVARDGLGKRLGRAVYAGLGGTALTFGSLAAIRAAGEPTDGFTVAFVGIPSLAVSNLVAHVWP